MVCQEGTETAEEFSVFTGESRGEDSTAAQHRSRNFKNEMLPSGSITFVAVGVISAEVHRGRVSASRFNAKA